MDLSPLLHVGGNAWRTNCNGWCSQDDEANSKSHSGELVDKKRLQLISLSWECMVAVLNCRDRMVHKWKQGSNLNVLKIVPDVAPHQMLHLRESWYTRSRYVGWDTDTWRASCNGWCSPHDDANAQSYCGESVYENLMRLKPWSMEWIFPVLHCHERLLGSCMHKELFHASSSCSLPKILSATTTHRKRWLPKLSILRVWQCRSLQP